MALRSVNISTSLRDAEKLLPALDHALQAAAQFESICTVVAARRKVIESDAGLAPSELGALRAIGSSDDLLTVTGLARTLGIHQSTASNLLKPLMDRGLAAATRSKEDRRALHLKLTARGRRALTRAAGPFGAMLAQRLSSLDDTTLRRLNRDLARVNAVLAPGAPSD
jgi:DNA-binding MarR family transcriptional regulator